MPKPRTISRTFHDPQIGNFDFETKLIEEFLASNSNLSRNTSKLYFPKYY